MARSTTPIPTNNELVLALKEAQEALLSVRAAVHDGNASADDLAKAEAGERFARTRIEAADEARYRRQRDRDKKRVLEIIVELDEIVKPLMAEQEKRREAMRALVQEYEQSDRELKIEIQSAYWELITVRDHDHSKRILRDLGVTVTNASVGVRVKNQSYGAPSTRSVLADLERDAKRKMDHDREAQNRRHRANRAARRLARTGGSIQN